MENGLTKEEVIELVKVNNVAFWCSVASLILSQMMFLLCIIPWIFWETAYYALAFKIKSGLAKTCWVIQMILIIPVLIFRFSAEKSGNFNFTNVIEIIYAVTSLILVISVYRFFTKQGLPASFITYISKANCEKYMNS